ncbi:MAG: hypothetical protein J2P20_16760, partial [Pseudonocardia sp.]|nr:hypothetical protein [Pseudonocardia sp.]
MSLPDTGLGVRHRTRHRWQRSRQLLLGKTLVDWLRPGRPWPGGLLLGLLLSGLLPRVGLAGGSG